MIAAVRVAKVGEVEVKVPVEIESDWEEKREKKGREVWVMVSDFWEVQTERAS